MASKPSAQSPPFPGEGSLRIGTELLILLETLLNAARLRLLLLNEFGSLQKSTKTDTDRGSFRRTLLTTSVMPEGSAL